MMHESYCDRQRVCPFLKKKVYFTKKDINKIFCKKKLVAH